MENLMSKNELTALLNNLSSQLNRLENKQDKQSDLLTEIRLQTQKTNGRVTALEKAKARKFNVPTSVLTLIASASFIVLYVIASFLGVKVPNIW